MEFNEKLSERRAVAVFEALVHDNNIAEDCVQLRWADEQMPHIPTQDE